MATSSVSWIAFGLSIASVLISGGVAFVNQRDKARYEAKLNYELEARKRLLEAIGPLRFQLLLACQDATARIQQLSSGNWNMNVKDYYGAETLYRILRPFAVAELIERQLNYVDFAVDSTMHNLLRFHAAALECLTGGTPVKDSTGERDLEGVDWGYQREHLFKGVLRAAASKLIVAEGEGVRCQRSYEFWNNITKVLSEERKVLSEERKVLSEERSLSVVTSFINGFSPKDKPIFWLRLISLGYVCREFIATDGKAAGFAPPDYPWVEMLQAGARRDILALDQVLGRRLSEMYLQALST
jgi:hypothetical protein